MSGCEAGNNAHKVGLGETGDTALRGRGRTQGGGNVLQGSDLSNITVWFKDVGPFNRNREKGRRGMHGLPQKYHEEAIAADYRQDVGDARERSSAGSGNK